MDWFTSMMDATCRIVEHYTLTGVLHSGPITVKRGDETLTVPEQDWMFLLPDAVHQVGKNTLSDEQFNQLNALIKERQLRMTEYGFASSYPIPLNEDIPEDRDPDDMEDWEVDIDEGEQY